MPYLKKSELPKPAPEIYFVKDDYAGNYRLGRTDWPSDAFNFIHADDFATFSKVYEGLGFKLLDKTHNED